MAVLIPAEIVARSVDVPLQDQAEEEYRVGNEELARGIIMYDFMLHTNNMRPDEALELARQQADEMIETWKLLYGNKVKI